MDGMSIEDKNNNIFLELKQFIVDIIGEDVVEEIDITPACTFTRDLEMDSIEIVAFAEKVKAKYGDVVDFAAWFSGMDLDDLVNLKLSDIINFITNEHSTN